MKEKALLIFFILFGVIQLSGQSLVDSLADFSCQCISKYNMDQISISEIELKLGLCIVEGISELSDQFFNDFEDIDFTNEEQMTQIGEKVGIKMVSICPDIFIRIAQLEEENFEATKTEHVILEGRITAITGDDIVTVHLEDIAGRQYKLLWLQYFEGSELLNENIETLQEQTFRVSCELVEFYSLKLDDYYVRKAIRLLEKL